MTCMHVLVSTCILKPTSSTDKFEKMNTLRFLGTGTSCGVPQIGCTCPVCTSSDPHDARLRTSVLLETPEGSLLFDCGPDFRQQMLSLPEAVREQPIRGVLLTHEHYDHVGGLDGLELFI